MSRQSVSVCEKKIVLSYKLLYGLSLLPFALLCVSLRFGFPCREQWMEAQLAPRHQSVWFLWLLLAASISVFGLLVVHLQCRFNVRLQETDKEGGKHGLMAKLFLLFLPFSYAPLFLQASYTGLQSVCDAAEQTVRPGSCTTYYYPMLIVLFLGPR